MTALVSADQSATVVALPEYQKYIHAKQAFYAHQNNVNLAECRFVDAQRGLSIAEKELDRATDELQLAIEEALKP